MNVLVCVILCRTVRAEQKKLLYSVACTKVLIERANYIQPILMTSHAEIFAKYCFITTDRY